MGFISLLLVGVALAGLPERVVLVIETRTEIDYALDGSTNAVRVIDEYCTVPDLPAYRYASSRTRLEGETEKQAYTAIKVEVAAWYQSMRRTIGPVEVRP
jgi:hypothetical protein